LPREPEVAAIHRCTLGGHRIADGINALQSALKSRQRGNRRDGQDDVLGHGIQEDGGLVAVQG
jgi:hypothetical protein